MPVNNFEDDVRRKMEELRFVPSGDVWKKVEENIREDRKRRRFLFWLPLTGLLIGGFIWFAWPARKLSAVASLKTASENTAVAHPGNKTLSDASAPKTPITARADSAMTAAPAASDNTTNATASGMGKNSMDPSQADAGSSATNRDENPKELKGNNQAAPTGSVITSEAEYLASRSRNTVVRKKTSSANPKKSAGGNNPSLTGPGSVQKDNTASSQDKFTEPVHFSDAKSATALSAATPGALMLKTDSAGNTIPAKKNAPATASKKAAKQEAFAANPASKKATGKDLNKKIEWGLSIFGGVSKQTEKNVIPSAILSRALANSTVYVIKNSELKTGPAFSIGFVVSKQLGEKWRLYSGINYAYYSSKLTNPGQYIAYPVNNSPTALLGIGSSFAALPSKKTSYTNRYQFIQIPVTLERQPISKWPLSVQAGVAFGYLSGIHALIYQPLLDQYWQDNTEFNKFQMTGMAGVYWKWKLDNNWSLRAGPELQYQLTNLMKSSVSVNDHLLTGAIRVILMHSAK